MAQRKARLPKLLKEELQALVDEGLDAWSSCYEGTDLDIRSIRVIVAIEPKQRVIVVTVVDLQNSGDL